MVVQVTLTAEFIILFPILSSISIISVDVLRLATFFSLIISVWILYKNYHELSGDYSNDHYSFLRFKSNPGIFKFLLQENGYTQIPDNPGGLVFGNPYAKVTIAAFLSLNCNPCAGVFKEIKALLDSTDKVKADIILSINRDEKSQKLTGQIYRLYKDEEKEKALEFMLRWYNGSHDEKNAILKSLPHEFPEIEKIAKNNAELFEKVKIPGTPTIYVNGYRFPRQYKVNDNEYFTEEIICLTMESKGQEACTHCK